MSLSASGGNPLAENWLMKTPRWPLTSTSGMLFFFIFRKDTVPVTWFKIMPSACVRWRLAKHITGCKTKNTRSSKFAPAMPAGYTKRRLVLRGCPSPNRKTCCCSIGTPCKPKSRLSSLSCCSCQLGPATVIWHAVSMIITGSHKASVALTSWIVEVGDRGTEPQLLFGSVSTASTLWSSGALLYRSCCVRTLQSMSVSAAQSKELRVDAIGPATGDSDALITVTSLSAASVNLTCRPEEPSGGPLQIFLPLASTSACQ